MLPIKEEKISFRTTTAKALLAMNRSEQLLNLSWQQKPGIYPVVSNTAICHHPELAVVTLMAELKRGGSQ
ncbi:hypothetical protein [Pelotalea chapellei]|uniref:Uncharacterized protein n=1 Tax=Pelotalea chapellei TaxID=44671 RepID=A0ABS5U6K9_9BACT|nr:hypothetical protein [Pelotalea chapellei]MBT1071288.1 hypothetical protein [Pelotalea chapellei]